jgi:hypothetical protein
VIDPLLTKTAATRSSRATSSRRGLGDEVASAGDVNGDGYAT